MANKRMFSQDIVGSDFFLDMPASTQALYFQLGMHADDRGFVQPKKIMRMLGSSENELQLLAAKRFVIPFEDGVLLIKHWRINNNKIDADRFRETNYTEHLSRVFIKENRAYTLDKIQGEPVRALIVHSSGTQSRVEQNRLKLPAQSAGFTIVKEGEKEKTSPKAANAEYEEGLQWAEERTGHKFINRTKQYAALKKAKLNGITIERQIERWKQLESDPFYQEKGLDWTMVINSFDRKS